MTGQTNEMKFWEIEFSRRALSSDPFKQSGRSKPFPLVDFLYSTQQSIKLLNAKPEHSILDVGCANGLTDIILSALCAEVLAIEPIKELVDIARQNLKDCPNVRVEIGNAEKINAPDRYFDRILMSGVLSLIRPGDISAVLAELLRVLKPNGAILISSNFNIHQKDLYMNKLDELLKSNDHISHDEKQYIIECHQNISWFDPDELIVLSHQLGAEATIHNPAPQETDSHYRFHLLMHLKKN